jgi:hypothetical protein
VPEEVELVHFVTFGKVAHEPEPRLKMKDPAAVDDGISQPAVTPVASCEKIERLSRHPPIYADLG